MSERQFSVIDPEQVARAPVTNGRTLEQRFRALLRSSPSEEIRRARIRRARELLAVGTLPVAEVGARSGFGDAKRFATVFRRLEGVSPSAYRKGLRSNRGDGREGSETEA